MTLFHARIFRGRAAAAAACAAFAFAVLAASEAATQSTVSGVPNAMQGFSQNRDQPIQIESVSLEMRDKKKEATFTGNVKVIQGDTTMTSKVLVVFYESNNQNPPPATPASSNTKTAAKSNAAQPAMQSATPGPGGTSSIRRLEAKGDVIVTQKDQVVTGETAVFDTKTNLITMMGGVVLTQGKNVLRGDRRQPRRIGFRPCPGPVPVVRPEWRTGAAGSIAARRFAADIAGPE
jgi:lipopolysaccharide export system protein LptA